MATVREGVMRREYAAKPGAGEVKKIQWQKFVKDADLAVKIIDREIAESKIDIKGAGVIVAGGYGMGSRRTSTWYSSWPTCWVPRWARAAQPSTPGSQTMRARWVRPV